MASGGFDSLGVLTTGWLVGGAIGLIGVDKGGLDGAWLGVVEGLTGLLTGGSPA